MKLFCKYFVEKCVYNYLRIQSCFILILYVWQRYISRIFSVRFESTIIMLHWQWFVEQNNLCPSLGVILWAHVHTYTRTGHVCRVFQLRYMRWFVRVIHHDWFMPGWVHNLIGWCSARRSNLVPHIYPTQMAPGLCMHLPYCPCTGDVILS